MKLSPAAELAVRGALVLADEYGRGPVTLEAVCSRRDLPRQYLVKIFATLAKAHIVSPIRGKGGGYILSRPPASITLLEVIEAIEGPIILNLCQASPAKCDNADCRFRAVWSELQETIRGKLASLTLALPDTADVPAGQAAGNTLR